MGRVNRKLLAPSRSRPRTLEDARGAGNYRRMMRRLRRVVPEILRRGMLALRTSMPKLLKSYGYDPQANVQ